MPLPDNHDMKPIAHWRQEIRNVLEEIGLGVVRAHAVTPPADVATVWFELGDDTVDLTRATLAAITPRLAFLALEDDDHEAFELLFVADTWLRIVYLHPDRVATEDGPEIATSVEDAHTYAAEAVEALTAADEPKNHNKVHQARDAIDAYIHDKHPDATDWASALGTDVWTYGNNLIAGLSERHIGQFRRDAERHASEIRAKHDIPVTTSRPTLRAIVYAAMKPLDTKCVTKASVEPIVLELERLIRTPPS